MFADYVKMAAKLALVAVITGAIVALFNIVTIPNFNIGALTAYMTIAYTFACHWCPMFPWLFTTGIALLSLELAFMGFDIAAMAWRWIFKVNE